MTLTRQQLLELDESRLRRDILLPLFREMGFKDVFEYHGQAMEQGKDIVMWSPDLAGTRINYAAVVKAKPISGQVSGKGGAGEVFAQVHQCFGSTYLDPHGTDRNVDRCFIVCPHQIKKEALAAIKSGLGEDKLSKTTILSGDQLWDKIDTHLSERTLLARAEDLRRRLIDSRIQGARVIIDAQHVRVELPPTAADGILRATVQFADDAKGRAALQAFQRHIDAGEPVAINGEHIVEWTTPEAMTQVIGQDRPARIELGVTETPEILFNIEVSSHARTVRVENVPFKGRAGRDEMNIRSALDTLSISLSLRFVRSTRQFTVVVHTTLEGRNVKQQLDGLRVQEALAAGGVLRVEFAATGQALVEKTFEPAAFDTANLRLLPLAEKLVAIQSATDALLSIPEVLSRDDLETVDTLARVTKGETLERPIQSIGITLTRRGAELILADVNAGKTLDLTMSSNDEFELLGVRVPAGQVVRQLKGLTLDEAARQSLSSAVAGGGGEPFDVTLTASAAGASETAVFLNWRPDDEASAWRTALSS